VAYYFWASSLWEHLHTAFEYLYSNEFPESFNKLQKKTATPLFVTII